MELLLIDDGSESYIEHSVINSQFKNTAQVRWFKKKHEGVSSARNTGIRNACGEYIWFADADDILAENSIDTILKHIKNGLSVDIIWGNHRKYTINGFLDRQEFDYGNGDWIRSCNSNTDQLLAYIYSGPLKTAGVWNNVYKKSVILNNQIWFDQSLILYEDVDWLIKMILVSKKIDFIRSPIYYYQTDNSESLTNHSYTIEKHECIYKVIKKWLEYFQTSYHEPYAKKIMVGYFKDQLRNTLSMIHKLPPSFRRTAMEMFQTFQNIINYEKEYKSE